MTAKRKQSELAEVEKQHGAVLAALDKLFAHEVSTSVPGRPALRLVHPALEAIDRDPVGVGLRAFITRRGLDLWAIGGHLELFAAVRYVMAARPERQAWNRTQLAALWGDIGIHPTGIRQKSALEGRVRARALTSSNIYRNPKGPQ
jgi:hypothetical protein